MSESSEGRLHRLWNSSIGPKIVMGLTGLIGAGFVLGHLAGNLQVYLGPDVFNSYAHFLQSTPEILWPTRITLLVAVILHVAAAVRLTKLNWEARPHAYAAARKYGHTSYAALFMRGSGVLLLAFIVFHILHLTTGTILPETHLPMDVFGNVVRGFRVWWVSAIYLVAMICLALHLYHGLWASPRTLGLEPPYAPKHQPLPQIVALLVWLGFTSIPVAVLLGYLHQ